MARKDINYSEIIGFLRKYYEIPVKTIAAYLEISEPEYLLMEYHKKPITLHILEKIAVLFLQPKSEFLNGKIAINLDKDFFKNLPTKNLNNLATINKVWLNQLEMTKLKE